MEINFVLSYDLIFFLIKDRLFVIDSKSTFSRLMIVVVIVGFSNFDIRDRDRVEQNFFFRDRDRVVIGTI